MTVHKKISFFVVLPILTIVSFGLGISFGLNRIDDTTSHRDANFAIEKKTVTTFPPPIQSKAFFDNAIQKANSRLITNKDAARSAVVAHHLLVADGIATTMSSLSSGASLVVVVSPNHFSVGRSAILTTKGSFNTPYGVLESDADAVDALILRIPRLQTDDLPFYREHGIQNLTPFIKHFFPQARIVSIVVDESASAEDMTAIGNAIGQGLPNAVFIASADMSHYLPEDAQMFHDDVTMACIERGGCPGTDLEVDSNRALDLLFAVNEARDTQAFELSSYTSSLSLGATKDWRENTSHIQGVFLKGEPLSSSFASLIFVGDIMLGRRVRSQIDKEGNDWPWLEVERLLRGSDIVVGNLEGAVNDRPNKMTLEPPFSFDMSHDAIVEMKKRVDIVSLANNHTRDAGIAGEEETRTHLKEIGVSFFGSFEGPEPRYDMTIGDLGISFIGYHAFRPNEVRLLQMIKEADAEGRFVVVFSHWGVEYQNTPSNEQRRLAKAMVKAGADLIVGSHPHVLQATETIDGVPVAYSLGNFIFDQDISSTWNAIALGVTIQDKSVTLYPMEIITKGGQTAPTN
ncbi:MAG: AmmeMemoRadiSam system protein B [Patescibacteria group bacterium]